MSQKKLVGRSVAIALGIACIILVAGIGGAMAYYMVTINSKDKTISQLNATIKDQNNTIKQLITNVTNLQNQNANLNSTYYNYMENHHYSDSEYDSLISQNTNLQTWLAGNETLLNETQAWLAGNETLLNQTQTELALAGAQIMNLTNENDQLQTWLNGNITSLEAQISTLNATITQMEEWLARGPPEAQLDVANTVQAWYPAMNLTKQFLFNCVDDSGTESNWVWLWNNGSVVDAAAFMAIIINPANPGHAGIEFCRCDAAGGDTLCVSINGTVYDNIFTNASGALYGYWGISE
jgi:uncharacterized coiled-coil protein SlyX